VGGRADVRPGIDNQRRAMARGERVLVTVEDILADAFELLAIAALKSEPGVLDRAPGAIHEPDVTHWGTRHFAHRAAAPSHHPI
jgi:hypothetical protein